MNEAALRDWATHARSELARTVPSTEVLRDIANQARHLYAVSTALATVSFTSGNLSGPEVERVHVELGAATRVMHAVQQQWETVTTATRPSREYVAATTALHTRLTTIESERASPGNHTDPARRINVNQALADLRYTATDLVELTHKAAVLPEPLIRAGLLFAPARILTSTLERLHDRNQGRYVAIRLEEGTELIDTAQQGSSAARHAQVTLEIFGRSTATTLPTQTLAAGPSSQDLEPATSLSGPDLF
jgi:hypothetical protein